MRYRQEPEGSEERMRHRQETEGSEEWSAPWPPTEPFNIIGPHGEPIIESGSQNSPDESHDKAQQSMFRDIDTVLARLENGIAVERAAIDALLDRLTSNAA